MRVRCLILATLASVAISAPASAAVFTTSASFDWTDSGFESLFLPQYAGPGAITAVTLTFTGETQRSVDVFAGDEPQSLPEQPVSWTVELAGPGVTVGGSTTFAPLGSETVVSAYPPLDLPSDPGGQYTRVTPIETFSITASDPRFGLYAGAGLNEFVAAVDISFPTRFRGTLTQVIQTTPIPEPATWALLILGFGAAGAMLRRRQAEAAA